MKCKEAHQKLVKLCKDEEKKTHPLASEKDKIVQRIANNDKLIKSKVSRLYVISRSVKHEIRQLLCVYGRLFELNNKCNENSLYLVDINYYVIFF